MISIRKISAMVLFLLIIGLLWSFWLSGTDRYFASRIYTFDGDSVKEGVIIVGRDGTVEKVREHNVVDGINPFLKRYEGQIILPGLVEPIYHSECVIRRVGQQPEVSKSVYVQKIRNFVGSYMSSPYQPWVTTLNEFFAVDSLYYKPQYLEYLVADQLSHGTTSVAIYPAPSSELALSHYKISKNEQLDGDTAVATAFSPGLKEEPIAELERRFALTKKPFLLMAGPGELVTLYRSKILTERTIVLFEGGSPTNEDMAVLKNSNAKLILSFGEDMRTIGRPPEPSLFAPILWGISSGAECSGSRSMLDELKTAKSVIRLSDEELWRIGSSTNAKMLNLNKGILAKGYDADFIVVSLSSDTLILDEVSPEKIYQVYQNGEIVLDHNRVVQKKMTLSQMRAEVDSLAKESGKHLGSASSYSAYNPLND